MFILAILLCIVTLVLILCSVISRDSAPLVGAAAVAFVVTAVVTVAACMSVVPTRNVGIVTAWGKPTGRTTGAGLKWTAPWQDIDDWDASGQTYAHLGDHCVWVTIAAQRRACIPLQIEWSARAEHAPANWAAYKQADDMSRFETWVARRVNPQINAAITSVFAAFDPLGGAKDIDNAAAPDLNKTYRKPLLAELDNALGADVTVKSIAFEAPRYDDPTSAAIAEYGKKVLDSRNLRVDKANAAIRASIVNELDNVDKVTQCLQIAEHNDKEPGLCMAGGVALTRPIG